VKNLESGKQHETSDFPNRKYGKKNQHFVFYFFY